MKVFAATLTLLTFYLITICQVMMGEPPAEFKAEVHKILLPGRPGQALERTIVSCRFLLYLAYWMKGNSRFSKEAPPRRPGRMGELSRGSARTIQLVPRFLGKTRKTLTTVTAF